MPRFGGKKIQKKCRVSGVERRLTPQKRLRVRLQYFDPVNGESRHPKHPDKHPECQCVPSNDLPRFDPLLNCRCLERAESCSSQFCTSYG
jgi:hypothetical protein